MKKFILILLLVSIGIGVAGKPQTGPHSGLWEQETTSKRFYIKVYFHAELGYWQFEYITYLLDAEGEPTEVIVDERYLGGEYKRLKRNLSSIILCRADKILLNRLNIKLSGKDIYYALRLTSDTTASFGLLVGNEIHEAYKFIKKVDY